MLGARLNKFLAFVIVASAMALTSVGNTSAQSGQSVEDFYRGKQVRFITGYSAGGLFDSATRIFARHLGKFIPGNPNVWVDNMTGAGGLIATNYLANAAPRDGTVMLNLDGALLRLQALGNAAAKFDARQFNWLSSPGPDIQVCWVSKASGWSSIFARAKVRRSGSRYFPFRQRPYSPGGARHKCQACGWFQGSYRNPTSDRQR